MVKYSIRGCAFGGDMFEYTEESVEPIETFVYHQTLDLTGGDDPKATGINIFVANSQKYVVEGLDRVFIVEEIG